MPEHLDLLVNRSILFDIGVALRHIGLGLVIVVIGDEVHDRVMGKELLELACQLGRERLIRRHDERRLAQSFDSLRHGVGLSRTSHTKKDLIAIPALHTLNERGDGLRLVARRLKGLTTSKRAGSLAAPNRRSSPPTRSTSNELMRPPQTGCRTYWTRRDETRGYDAE